MDFFPIVIDFLLVRNEMIEQVERKKEFHITHKKNEIERMK